MYVGGGAELHTGPPYPAGSRSRLIVELAIATNTAPAAWRDEPDEVLATALDVMEQAASKRKG